MSGGGDGMPRVSIGLPVYQAEDTVGRALDSLRAQTFRDLEIVVSDNASTDGTARLCRERAASDPRIRYVRQ
ncbi:MAG TPA: glycosyltransferase, partial [Longimicrobiaceae bacterium]|nr:glycosyltransferase [Longimicrobiaceae bacterium]